MSKNANLHNAKSAGDDEYYTLPADVDSELPYYKPHFKGRTIYCPCDHHPNSAFVHHLTNNFHEYQLAKLIATGYNPNGKGSYYIYNGKDIHFGNLNHDGDFRCPESQDFFNQADIIITNPPFSPWRQFFQQVIDYNLDYILIGSQNAITYKNVFPHIRDNKLWLGANKRIKEFIQPDGTIKQFGNINWFTNLDHGNHPPPLELTQSYHADPSKYPTYDNYPAIEVSRVENIPYDYDGEMGVPISYIEKHCPSQFNFVANWNDGTQGEDIGATSIDIPRDDKMQKWNGPALNGQPLFSRLIIKGADHEQPQSIGGRFYVNGERQFNRVLVSREDKQDSPEPDTLDDSDWFV